MRWDDQSYGRFTWLPIGKGKYQWMTAPYVILTDPAYFYWALNESDDLIRGAMLHQAEIIVGRAAHIRPQVQGRRVLFEFASDWRLRSISAGRKKAGTKRARIVKRKHLNLAVARQLSERGDTKGVSLLERFVIGEYFAGAAELDPRRAELFFENDDNFDLTCQESDTSRQLS